MQYRNILSSRRTRMTRKTLKSTGHHKYPNFPDRRSRIPENCWTITWRQLYSANCDLQWKIDLFPQFQKIKLIVESGEARGICCQTRPIFKTDVDMRAKFWRHNPFFLGFKEWDHWCRPLLWIAWSNPCGPSILQRPKRRQKNLTGTWYPSHDIH